MYRPEYSEVTEVFFMPHHGGDVADCFVVNHGAKNREITSFLLEGNNGIQGRCDNVMRGHFSGPTGISVLLLQQCVPTVTLCLGVPIAPR